MNFLITGNYTVSDLTFTLQYIAAAFCAHLICFIVVVPGINSQLFRAIVILFATGFGVLYSGSIQRRLYSTEDLLENVNKMAQNIFWYKCDMLV